MKGSTDIGPGPFRAITYSGWGGSEVLEYLQGSAAQAVAETRGQLSPVPPGFLRVAVTAISVNPVDWKIMAGEQKGLSSRRFPRVFGSDFSGRVLECGPTSGFEPGDRIMGMIPPLSAGSGMSVLKVPAGNCVRIPDGVSEPDAAGLPAAGISAILATGFADEIVTGRVLVIGAAGGVGSLAVQRLLFRGWEVWAVARRGSQQDRLRELGCTNFYNREERSSGKGWEENALTRSWDAILDSPGILHRRHPRRYIKPGGWYSPVYVPNSLIPVNILSRPLWWMSHRRTSMFLAWPSPHRLNLLEACLGMGSMKPVTDSVWDAADCAAAVDHAITGPLCGKVIIRF